MFDYGPIFFPKEFFLALSGFLSIIVNIAEVGYQLVRVEIGGKY